MKFLLIACLGLAAAPSRIRQQRTLTRGAGDFSPWSRTSVLAPEPQRSADRPAPQREADPVRASAKCARPAKAVAARMSEDERRQLRRDIQDAGKDIYRRLPRRPGANSAGEKRVAASLSPGGALDQAALPSCASSQRLRGRPPP